MKEFAKFNFTKPEHFNQSVFLSIEGLNTDVLRKALEAVVKHHDVLRSVYRNGELIIISENESRLFDMYEFDIRNEVDKRRIVDEKCNEIQASINLENGPLVKAVVFDIGDNKLVSLIIHHCLTHIQVQ